MDAVIISRHPGAVAWLAARGITGTVIAQATDEDVRGRHVVGNVPLHLAALAASVTVIDLPGLAPEQRGKDLSPEELDAAGATLTRYVVRADPVREIRTCAECSCDLLEDQPTILCAECLYDLQQNGRVQDGTLALADGRRVPVLRNDRPCNCGTAPVMAPHEFSPWCG